MRDPQPTPEPERFRHRYEVAPIQEAVCEFRLRQSTAWDMATPGLLYPGLQGLYPERRQRADAEPAVVQNDKGESVATLVKVDRIVYSAKDGKSFVQVGPRMVSIHRLRPYESWEGFSKQVAHVYEVLRPIVGATSFERIGLRYLNRLDIPGPQIAISDFLKFRPETGSQAAEAMIGVQMACTFGVPGGTEGYRVMLVSLVPDDPTHAAFMLDIDYFTVVPGRVQSDTALSWIETAHANVENVFEGCITDKLRGLFK